MINQSMTIQKKEMGYESYDSLTHKDFTGGKLKVKIVEKPRLVKTKFMDDQPVIIVEMGVEKKTWWSNWTSLNSLIDQYGTDESKMVSQTIELELVSQPVQGVMKKVIYLKDSLKSED